MLRGADNPSSMLKYRINTGGAGKTKTGYAGLASSLQSLFHELTATGYAATQSLSF